MPAPRSARRRPCLSGAWLPALSPRPPFTFRPHPLRWPGAGNAGRPAGPGLTGHRSRPLRPQGHGWLPVGQRAWHQVQPEPPTGRWTGEGPVARARVRGAEATRPPGRGGTWGPGAGHRGAGPGRSARSLPPGAQGKGRRALWRGARELQRKGNSLELPGGQVDVGRALDPQPRGGGVPNTAPPLQPDSGTPAGHCPWAATDAEAG